MNFPRYMMATRASHQLGDISQLVPSLCRIRGEEDEDFIGEWVEGYGYINVRFPKATTRELTAEEKQSFQGMVLHLNGRPYGVLQLKTG